MVTATTTTTATAWSPDVQAFAPADVVPDALILTTSTQLGTVEGDAQAVRVAYVDDAAAAVTSEGAEISESDPDFDEVLIYTQKVTQLVKLSREQYGQEGTADGIGASVSRAVTRKANVNYLTQVAPTSPAVTPPAGLLNVSGITAGGAVATNLDILVDLVAELEANEGTPSHIILDPIGWASLRKFKDETASARSLLGAGTTDADRFLLGLPVIVSPAMTAGTGLVLDNTAVVSAVGNLEVATSEHAAFTSDGVVVRCTWRFGQNVVHPERIGKFTVTAPAAG